MLTIPILIGVAILFNRKALSQKRNPYLWSAVGVLSYLVLPFIMSTLITLFNNEWLQEELLLLIANLFLSILGISIAYYVLEKLPIPTDIKGTDSDLLDSDID